MTKGSFPFFKYCPSRYRDYYINKISSEVLKYDYNFQVPRTFNEKVRWLVCNENLDLKTKLTDKILVKGYIAQKLGVGHSAEIYGVYFDFDEIDFSILPDKFALKANHGWRMNMIINNKNVLKDKNNLKKITDIWLDTDFYYYNVEPQYKNIHKKLFVEYLRPNINMFKTQRCDIKFHCFNGNVAFVEIPFWENEHKYFLYVTPEFQELEFSLLPKNYNSHKKEKPNDWEKMIEYSKTLSRDFTYVRVDLEHNYDEIHVVELTFSPYAAKMPFIDKKYDFEYGEMLDISKVMKEKSI